MLIPLGSKFSINPIITLPIDFCAGLSDSTDILCVVKHHHNLIYRISNKSTINQVMNRATKAMLVLHE